MELLSLIYSYTDTETIQAIMEEVPGSWASIINPQYQKTQRIPECGQIPQGISREIGTSSFPTTTLA